MTGRLDGEVVLVAGTGGGMDAPPGIRSHAVSPGLAIILSAEPLVEGGPQPFQKMLSRIDGGGTVLV